MWNEDQLRLWHHLCAKDSISGRDRNNCKRFYGKKGIVLCHCCSPKESNLPMPVAEMITNYHSAPSIRTFIERFRRDEGAIFKGKPQIPSQMNTQIIPKQ